MTKTGRPSKYDKAFPDQARKLCLLGATDIEIADFFEVPRSEDEFYAEALRIIRLDRRGVIAAQKRARATLRARRSPSAKVKNAVQARMWAALKGRSGGHLFSRLGYTLADLVAHLERLFRDGMTWDNYGKWHVDHVRPCAAFDLTDSDQFHSCWALDNLQPLWASDNVRKGARCDGAA